MIRQLGVQTFTGVAQPLMSDVTTAAVIAPPDGQDAYITVASNAIYQSGDRIVLEPGTANQDVYRVVAFRTAAGVTSTTVMQCTLEGSTGHAHANGVTIQLAINAVDVVVQLLSGTTGNAFIGADNTVTMAVVPGGSAIQELFKTTDGTATVPWHMAGGTDHNIVNSADAWMIGTASDKALVYALVQ